MWFTDANSFGTSSLPHGDRGRITGGNDNAHLGAIRNRHACLADADGNGDPSAISDLDTASANHHSNGYAVGNSDADSAPQ